MAERKLTSREATVGLLLPSIFLIIAMIMNSQMREGLFLLGINIISDMQTNQGSVVIFIENLFSLLGNPIIIFTVIGIQVLFFKIKIRTYVNLIYLMAGLYIMVVLKQAFQQSRPFWYDSSINILQWFCPIDFGNPSGHSFIVFSMYEPLLSDFIGTGKKRILLFIWVVLAVGTVISRMYLGAHSFDQVIFGSLIGMCCLIIYKFWLQQVLYDIIKDILLQKNKKINLIFTSAIWILFFIVPIVCFQLNNNLRQMPIQIINRVNEKCSHQGKDSLYYQKAIFQSTIAPFFGLGLLYGYLFLKNTKCLDVSYMLGLWTYQSNLNFLKEIGLLIVIVGFPAAILILAVPLAFTSAIISYVFKVIGATWAGFAFIYPMSVLRNKFNLINYNTQAHME